MHEEHGSWLNALVRLLPPGAEHYVDLMVVTSWLVIALLVLLAWLGTRRRQLQPQGLQTVWELYYDFVRGFVVKELGPEGERHVPLLGTLLLYILFMNLFGLIPGFVTPTMSLNTTAALALVVFGSVQYWGLRTQGWRYLLHFLGEPLGDSLGMKVMYVVMAPVMLAVHLTGELAKPLSLAIRLFGNMFGEETAIARMAALGALVMATIYVPVPVQIVNVLLHLLIGPIQAYIFFLLGTAYIQMATAPHSAQPHSAPGESASHHLAA